MAGGACEWCSCGEVGGALGPSGVARSCTRGRTVGI